VGEPAQEIDLIVSTSISELWVVEDSGCNSKYSTTVSTQGLGLLSLLEVVPLTHHGYEVLIVRLGALCIDKRGGVFVRSKSKSWSPMGLWQLGLKASGIYANGDYGIESLLV
jgi:hypothetical protein